MQIEVRVFAHFVDYLPPADRKEKASRIKIRTGSRIIDVIEQLGIPRGEVSLVMRNDEQSSVEQKLKDGDTVGIFPPIAGGLDEQLEAGIGSKSFPLWNSNFPGMS